MRYHHKKVKTGSSMHGRIYICDHPVYTYCTLYSQNKYGLAVIQQRYNERNKSTYWNAIDRELVDEIFFNPNFQEVFDERADVAVNGLYPTVTVRQLMWALKMKPLRREVWETCFDRRNI